MKKISEHLGEIIIALAGICLIVTAVITFKAPIGAFFKNTVSNLIGISTEVVDNIENPDFTPEPETPGIAPDGSSYKWAPMTWNGEINNFYGRLVWTDGEDFYYSKNGAHIANSTHYKLNKETNTWETYDWGSVVWFGGDDIWTDGTNTYLSFYDSKASYSNRYQHYVLQDGKWVTKTWNYTNFTGSNIWKGKNFVFYSSGTTQLALQNGKWLNAANAFTGLKDFNGANVWTDGTSFYYSFTTKQYKLNGWAWESITWQDLPNNDMDGPMIWTDGENMYYSLTNKQYKINTETLTLEPVNWTGLDAVEYGLCGADVWTDGTNLYFSVLDFDGGSIQYIRVKN